MVVRNAVSFVLSLLVLLPLAVPVAGQCVDHGRSLRVAASRPVAGEVGASVRMGDLILLSADSAGLTVFDLAIPDIPWYIAEHPLSLGLWRVAAAGETAVVAAADADTLLCIDMTTPASPRNAGGLALPGPAIDIAAGSDHAYVLCGITGGGIGRRLVTVDVSDPDAPEITDDHAVSDQSTAVDLRGAVLAVAAPLPPVLRLYDLASPDIPAFTYGWQGGGLIRDVVLTDERAWLIGDGILKSVNIVGAPVQEWSHPEPRAWTAGAVDGTRLHLLGDPTADGIGYEIIETAFESPVVIGSSAMMAVQVTLEGPWSYLAGTESGFAVIDWSDLQPTPPVGVVGPASEFDVVTAVAAQGDVAAALLETRTAQGGPTSRLWICDVTDPAQPVRTFSLDVQGEPRGVAIEDDLVAVITYVEGINRGKLTLVDVTNPEVPTAGATVFLGGDPQALYLRGDYVLVFVVGTNVLGVDDHTQLVWAGDPAAPSVAILQPLPAPPRAYGVSGDTLVIAMDGVIDQTIYDATMSATLVESWITSFSFSSATMDGPRLAFGGDGYVITAEFTQTGQINFHTSLPLPGRCSGLMFEGDVLYAAADDLVAVDVTDFETPSWAGIVGPGAGRGVAAATGALVAAAGPRGMELLVRQCDGDVAVEDPPDGDDDTPIARSALLAPSPNPFNPSVRVAFELARPGRARVTVHDLNGALVSVLADGVRTIGRHDLEWRGRRDDGRAAPAGVYIVRLSTTDGVDTRKVSLIR